MIGAWGTDGPALDALAESLETVAGIPVYVLELVLGQVFILGTASLVYVGAAVFISQWSKR